MSKEIDWSRGNFIAGFGIVLIFGALIGAVMAGMAAVPLMVFFLGGVLLGGGIVPHRHCAGLGGARIVAAASSPQELMSKLEDLGINYEFHNNITNNTPEEERHDGATRGSGSPEQD